MALLKNQISALLGESERLLDSIDLQHGNNLQQLAT